MGRITLGRIARILVTVGVVLGVTIAVASPASAAYTQVPRTTTWSPTSGRVYAIARIGSTVYIGGSFTAVRNPNGTATVARSRLAAFDADTGALLPWNPGANNDVRALQPTSDGSGLIVGGLFTNVAGGAQNRIARVDSQTGALVTSFNAAVNGAVYALARVGTQVIAGGGFSTYRGQSRPRLASFDESNGTATVGWTGSADSIVKSLLASPDGDRFLVGGQFHTLSGQSRDYIGAVTTTGTATSWRPPAPCSDVSRPCYVLDLAQDTGKVYAAVGGPGGRVVAYDVSSGVRRWAAYGDGDVQAIAVDDGVVYAGGHFGPTFSNSTRQGMVALDANTGGVLDFAPQFFNGLKVWDILPGDDALRVGGGFTRVNTSSLRQRYAEFPLVPDVPDGTPPSVPGGLHTTNVSDTIVALSWSPSTDDHQVAGYRLWRDGQVVAPTGVTNYTDRDLQPSTTYSYQVQASDSSGNWSDLSDPVPVTTAPPSNSLVKVGSAWRYLSDGSNQGTAWSA